jgi:hypothetical protein
MILSYAKVKLQQGANMTNRAFYKGVFAVAAIYDLAIGIVFFLFYKTIFSIFDIQLPQIPVYIHLLAAFVFVQGITYGFVYFNLENVDIIKIGIVYKIVYMALAFYYWAVGGLPHPLFGLFGVFDLIFAILFVLCLRNYDALAIGNASTPQKI